MKKLQAFSLIAGFLTSPTYYRWYSIAFRIVFSMEPRFWLNLQSEFDMRVAKRNWAKDTSF